MEAERTAMVTWTVGAVVCLLLILLGWLASPVDRLTGRPLLLLPDVKAVEDYRRQAASWMTDLRMLDSDLAQLLAGDVGDLFEQSRRSQAVLERAARLVKAIDVHPAPPTLSGLQMKISQAALAYLETAHTASDWVSVPDEEHYMKAEQALNKARTLLDELEESQWLKEPH
jgi:hypothetical protein